MAGTDQTARQYQDAITNAALQEAWASSNGDPAMAAMYYHGGSDRSKWGPRTRAYAQHIVARMGR